MLFQFRNSKVLFLLLKNKVFATNRPARQIRFARLCTADNGWFALCKKLMQIDRARYRLALAFVTFASSPKGTLSTNLMRLAVCYESGTPSTRLGRNVSVPIDILGTYKKGERSRGGKRG